MRKRTNKKGLTLIELVIVGLTMVIISFAVYATLANGIKIWQKICQERPEEDANIFFEKFTFDLRNVIRYKDAGFSGEDDEFAMPAIIASQRMNFRTVGRIRYLFDKEKGIVERYAVDFSDIYYSREGIRQVLISDIRSARFQYYVYDAATKQYFWQDEWRGEALPLAIRVELEITRGGKIVQFARTVGIPVGNQ